MATSVVVTLEDRSDITADAVAAANAAGNCPPSRAAFTPVIPVPSPAKAGATSQTLSERKYSGGRSSRFTGPLTWPTAFFQSRQITASLEFSGSNIRLSSRKISANSNRTARRGRPPNAHNPLRSNNENEASR